MASLLLTAAGVAQINFTETFNPQTNAFTGNFALYTGTSMCGGSGLAMLRQLSPTQPSGVLGSFAGVSTGAPCSFKFDYKVCTVASGNVTAAPTPWGNILVQIGSTATGPWTNIGVISNEVQTGNCITRTFSFTPPAGPVFFQFASSYSNGVNWVNFDNIDIQVTSPCSGPLNPGNTVGPVDSCPQTNFTLSFQNVIAGAGLSYQWYSSTTSGTGPWTPISGATAKTLITTQAASTWYYCEVNCSNGPTSANSAPLFVPQSTPIFPQEFATGTLAVNCWSLQAVTGNFIPAYFGLSAFGVGTGSAVFGFSALSTGFQPALVSPIFSPMPAGAVATFDVAGATAAGDIDQIVLEQSIDGGVTWTTALAMNNSVTGLLNPFGITQAAGYVPTANEWSSVTVPVGAGTNRIRFRGISDDGNNVFLDNIGVFPSQPAYHKTVGVGCYDFNTSSFVERFPTASAAKAALDGNSLVFLNTGSSYFAVWNTGGGAFVPPTPAATPLTFADNDDGQVTYTPSLTTPIPGGSTSDWTISVNGIVTAGPLANNLGDFTPTLPDIGTAAGLGFYSWNDFNLAEGGQILVEEVGATLFITWNGVEAYPAAPVVNPSTFQFQIDMTTGNVTIAWASFEAIAVTPTIAGATLAGTGPTPPSRLLTSAASTPFSFGGDIAPMRLSAVGRPINLGPAPTYTIDNIPEFLPGAGVYGLAIVFGQTNFPGGLDLGLPPFNLGAPGCFAYTSPDILFVLGLVPTPSISFPMMWNIPIPPLQFWMQALSQFTPNSLPNGLNPGGYATSNALEIFVESF